MSRHRCERGCLAVLVDSPPLPACDELSPPALNGSLLKSCLSSCECCARSLLNVSGVTSPISPLCSSHTLCIVRAIVSSSILGRSVFRYFSTSAIFSRICLMATAVFSTDENCCTCSGMPVDRMCGEHMTEMRYGLSTTMLHSVNTLEANTLAFFERCRPTPERSAARSQSYAWRIEAMAILATGTNVGRANSLAERRLPSSSAAKPLPIAALSL